MENLTVVGYYGKQTNKCGYCKGVKCSIAHGMHAYVMGAQDYQDLIDRGWRRSGTYCYKPDNKVTCCPCYTIKCDAVEFKLSKSHKKVLKRMNRFLRDGKKQDASDKDSLHNDITDVDNYDDAGGGGDEPQAPNLPIAQINVDVILASSTTDNQATKTSTDEITSTDSLVQPQTKEATTSRSPSTLYDGQKPPCKKAKQIRLERRQAKLAAKGVVVNDRPSQQSVGCNQGKTLAEYLAETRDTDKHKLKIVLVPAKCDNVTTEVYEMYVQYKIAVHNTDPERLLPTNLIRFLCKTPIQLKLVQVGSPEFLRTLVDSFSIYKLFQSAIHHDPPKHLEEYLDFLGESPLKHKNTQNDPPMGYGSFHQQYWLDDKLIAVGVIDILPYCVSSVYFFYDPEYSFLSLGTYGSLREIDLVQQLCRGFPALRNYYMGFYIHTCPKMQYKGKLTPSYLLCSETYTWHMLTDEIRLQLDEHKYLRFSSDASVRDVNEFRSNDLDLIPLVVDNRCLLYRQYIQTFKIETVDNMLDLIRSRIYKHITGDDDNRDEILEYGRLVGRICAHRLRLLKT